MKILAVDTSSKICSVAILEDDKLVDEIDLDNGKTHSENLMPITKEILERNNLQLNNIDLIAVSVGPGSFTGIRIGIASIKPIAEIYRIPVASVTSLETLAQNVQSQNATIVSIIDAKNNQVYCGIFDSKLNLLESEIADDINIALEKSEKYSNLVFVGDGAEEHKELIKNKFGDSVSFCENNTQKAVNTGKVGYKKYLAGDLKNADTILPVYLRKSQAERLKNK